MKPAAGMTQLLNASPSWLPKIQKPRIHRRGIDAYPNSSARAIRLPVFACFFCERLGGAGYWWNACVTASAILRAATAPSSCDVGDSRGPGRPADALRVRHLRERAPPRVGRGVLERGFQPGDLLEHRWPVLGTHTGRELVEQRARAPGDLGRRRPVVADLDERQLQQILPAPGADEHAQPAVAIAQLAAAAEVALTDQ